MFGPTTKAVTHLLGAVVAVACALFALAVWRITAGPISLAFLAPYVEQALVAEQSRVRLSFDDLVLTWAGWERAIDIRARGVRAIATDGGALAGVPEMAIGLSLPALARGLIAPTRLDVFGAGVRLVRTADGRLDLDFGAEGDGRQRGIAEALLQMFVLSPEPGSAASYLSELSIVDSRLVIRDQRLGVEWTAPAARLKIERRTGGLLAGAILKLEVADQLVDVTASADYDSGGRLAKVGLTFSELNPAKLAGLADALAPLARFDLPVGGRLDLVGSGDGSLREVAFDLVGGAGRIALSDVLGIDAGRDVALVQARGVLTDGLARLAMDELYIDFGGPTATMAGQAVGDWRAPELTAEVELRGVPVAEIGRYWPDDVAAGARAWVGERMTEGVVDRLALRLAVNPGDWNAPRLARDQIDARFEIRGATVAYSPTLPPVTGVDAGGHFDGGALHAEIRSGASGPLEARAGTVELQGYDAGRGRAEVSVAFSGSLPETLAGLARTPFAASYLQGINVDAVSGRAEGDIAVALPMVPILPEGAVRVSVGADLHALDIEPGGLSMLAAGVAISGGEAAFLLDGSGFDLTGEAQLDGTPASFFWHESFAAEADIRRRIDVTARLDDAARARLGFADQKISGPIDVELRINDLRDGSRVGELDVGATQAQLALPVLDWRKPPGEPASARFALELDGSGIARVPRFGVQAEGLSAAGSARRDGAGLWTLAFDRLVAGSTDVRGEVRVRADQGYDVAVYGRRLDLRPYFAGAGAEPAGAVRPFNLIANVDTVLLGETLVLHKVEARSRFDGAHVTDAAFTCDLGRAKDVAFSLEGGAPGQRRFSVAADDAGAVFEALDVTPNLIGGALSVEGVIDDTGADAPLAGTIRVSDFHMVDAPVLAKLLNVVSITGALEMLKGSGIPFDRLEAQFAYRDDVLTLKEGLARGLSIGLTLEGEVDLARDWIDLAGTIVPAYFLNTALGRIPVIGDILTGGEGEGVFAATFVAEGPRQAPSVFVNPLAVLAPGILRDLISKMPLGTPLEPWPGGRSAH